MSELEVTQGHLCPRAFVGIPNEYCRFRGRLFLFFNKQKCEIDLDIDIIAMNKIKVLTQGKLKTH